jgi:hypothetical protein
MSENLPPSPIPVTNTDHKPSHPKATSVSFLKANALAPPQGAVEGETFAQKTFGVFLSLQRDSIIDLSFICLYWTRRTRSEGEATVKVFRKQDFKDLAHL